MLVARVTQSEHGIAQLRERLGRSRTFELLGEPCCRLRRRTVAVRTRDDDDRVLALERSRFVVREVDDIHLGNDVTDSLRELLCEPSGVAGFGSVEHTHPKLLGGARLRRRYRLQL